MFNPLDSKQTKLAVTPRANMLYLTERESEALDIVYGDVEGLRLRILPFSSKEDPNKLQWRREVSVDHLNNNGEEVARTYIEQVFKAKEITRTAPVDDTLAEWIRTRFDTFMQAEAGALMLACPELYFYLEWPEGETPYSQADQQASEMWPRPSIVKGSCVTRVVEDSDGKIDWIARKMVTDVAGKAVTWFEVRDNDNIYALDEKGGPLPMLTDRAGNTVAIDAHGIPNGSVVRAEFIRNHRRSNRYTHDTCGQSFLHSVIRLTLARLQVVSMLVEGGYFFLTNQFYADVATLAAIKENGGMGNTAPIPVPMTNGDEKPIIPGYVQKDTNIMDALAKWAFEYLPTEIYRAARLRDRSTDKTANTSGLSKAMDAVPETAALAQVANYLRDVDSELLKRICGAYDQNCTPDKVSVAYPSRFIVKSDAESLADMKSLVEIAKDKTAPRSRELLVQLFNEYIAVALPDLPEDVKQTIADQLAEEQVVDTTPPNNPIANGAMPDGVAVATDQTPVLPDVKVAA